MHHFHQYKSIYKDLHNQNATEYINKLVEKSKVDVELNRETVKKIRKLETDHQNIVKDISKNRTLMGLLIFLIIAGLLGGIYAVMQISSLGFEGSIWCYYRCFTFICDSFVILYNQENKTSFKRIKNTEK